MRLICTPHYQRRVKVGLTHLIENQYDTLVPVVLASRSENDAIAVGTHWLVGLHMPTPDVFASTIQHCAAIVESF